MLEAGRRRLLIITNSSSVGFVGLFSTVCPLIITNSSSGGLTPPAALLPTHERQLKGSRINLILSELDARLPTSGCYIYYRPKKCGQKFLIENGCIERQPCLSTKKLTCRRHVFVCLPNILGRNSGLKARQLRS